MSNNITINANVIIKDNYVLYNNLEVYKNVIMSSFSTNNIVLSTINNKWITLRIFFIKIKLFLI